MKCINTINKHTFSVNCLLHLKDKRTDDNKIRYMLHLTIIIVFKSSIDILVEFAQSVN